MASTTSHDQHIDSLYLKTNPRKHSSETGDTVADDTDGVQCLICAVIVANSISDPIDSQSTTDSAALQKHLLTEHNLIIGDIDTIADLKEYCKYWRPKFANTDDRRPHEWTRFCAAIDTNSGPKDVAERDTYYMIGGGTRDQFPEDTALRERLRERRLEAVLRQSESERNDTAFSRMCIFCRKVFTENRATLLCHLADDHNFNVGNPDNIVFSAELLDVMERRVNALQCLYCERTFKSWSVLKEHMRKKGHKLLNPDNRQYDKYYLINYLSPERDWRDVKREVDVDVVNTDDHHNDGTNDDDTTGDGSANPNDWNGWSESGDDQCICLFCEFAAPVDQLKSHMKTVHEFDLDRDVVHQLADFYQRIKLINFIRRSIHERRCHRCDQLFESRDQLLVHLDFSGHMRQLPDESKYDAPDYYFSTFENDNLLHFLDVIDNDKETIDGQSVATK